MLNACNDILLVSMYVYMHAWCVYRTFCPCMSDCVYVSTRVSVQDTSGCLWYFTFPFRQRVSRLAPNEPITGSSIWCVLYGSPGSTISADESWERWGEWVGQHGGKCTNTRSLTHKHKAGSWLYDLFGMECIKEGDARGAVGFGVPSISSNVIKKFLQVHFIWWPNVSQCLKKWFLINEEILLAVTDAYFSAYNKRMKTSSISVSYFLRNMWIFEKTEG